METYDIYRRLRANYYHQHHHQFTIDFLSFVSFSDNLVAYSIGEVYTSVNDHSRASTVLTSL